MATSAAAAPAGPAAQQGAVPGTCKNVWGQDTTVGPTRPPLPGDATADVCVVGGGLSGLTAALMCAKAGLSVILLESRAVGAGMSGRSAGHVTAWDPNRFERLEGRHGFGVARQVARARLEAFDWIRSTIKEEGIDCGYQEVPAYLMAGPSANLELEACRSTGLGGRELGGSPGPAADAGGPAGAARLPGASAQLDPVRYAQGLAAALERRGARLTLGGRIYEGVRVKSGPFTISGKVATLTTNSTDGPSVHASRGIVVATHSPINRSLAIHARQSPWRTCSMAFELPDGAAPAPGLYYSPDGHHARFVEGTGAPGGCGPLLLVGGGSDHVVGQMRERYADKDPYASLEAWARGAFPDAGRAEQRWSSVVFRPADLLGLYGINPLDAGSPKTRVITGHSGDSIVGAAVAGLALVPGLAGAGPGPEWAGIFEPSRLRSLGNWGSLGNLATEIGLNVRGYARILAPTCWRDVVGLVVPGRVEEGIEPGDGQVVQEGLRKVALYRDEEGTLHRRSALCPHMHVLVQWNPVDKTFDCPGHGSVFDPCGRCVSGPSARDLEDLGWRREAEGRGEGGGSLVK